MQLYGYMTASLVAVVFVLLLQWLLLLLVWKTCLLFLENPLVMHVIHQSGWYMAHSHVNESQAITTNSKCFSFSPQPAPPFVRSFDRLILMVGVQQRWGFIFFSDGTSKQNCLLHTLRRLNGVMWIIIRSFGAIKSTIKNVLWEHMGTYEFSIFKLSWNV